jgi:hypothetical protein
MRDSLCAVVCVPVIKGDRSRLRRRLPFVSRLCARQQLHPTACVPESDLVCVPVIRYKFIVPQSCYFGKLSLQICIPNVCLSRIRS